MFDVLDSNYKNHLLEIAQKFFGVARPEYVHFEYGPAHDKVFYCICLFEEQTSLSEGRTKIEAEQFASREMLTKVQKAFFKRREKEWVFTHTISNGLLSQEMMKVLGDLKKDSRFGLWSLYGDALLRYFIARDLYERYPQFQEGVLTRILSEALKEETRASLARFLSLEHHVPTAVTSRLLAETLSAVVGKLAFTLMEADSRQLVMEYYQQFNDRAVARILEREGVKKLLCTEGSISTNIHNFKGELFERAQRMQVQKPRFTQIESQGPAHDPLFRVEGIYRQYTEIGCGKTIKSAEQDASKKILTQIKRHEAGSLRFLRKSTSYNIGLHEVKEFDKRELHSLRKSIHWPHLEIEENLISALTHPSKNGESNYQRLEFLGDAILRKILIGYILKNYSIQDKSYLASSISQLVSATTQESIAMTLRLEEFILTDSPITTAVLSDVLEALVAAMYLKLDSPAEDKVKALESVIALWYQAEIQKFFGKTNNSRTMFFRAKESPSSVVSLAAVEKMEEHSSVTLSAVMEKKGGLSLVVSSAVVEKKTEVPSVLAQLETTQEKLPLSYVEVLKRAIPSKKPKAVHSRVDSEEFPSLGCQNKMTK